MSGNARDKYSVIPVRYICALFMVYDVKEAEPRYVKTSKGVKVAKELYSKATGTPYPFVTTYLANDTKFATEAKKYPIITDNTNLKQKRRGK